MKFRALWLAILSSVTLSAAPSHAAATDANFGFQAAFHRHIHMMKSFELVVAGTTIVAARAFTYLTAGAGTPPAAARVSTVASRVTGRKPWRLARPQQPSWTGSRSPPSQRQSNSNGA